MRRDQLFELRCDAGELGPELLLFATVQALPVGQKVLLAMGAKPTSEIFDRLVLKRSGLSVHGQVRRSLL